MNPKKMFFRSSWAICILFIFCLLVTSVMAVGIAPIDRTIEFEAGGEGEYVLIVVNTLNQEVEVQLSESDPLGIVEINYGEGFGDLENEGILLSPKEEKYLSYNVSFGESISEFGEVAKITVTEKVGDGPISAQIVLSSKIIVSDPNYVPAEEASSFVKAINFLAEMFGLDENDKTYFKWVLIVGALFLVTLLVVILFNKNKEFY